MEKNILRLFIIILAPVIFNFGLAADKQPDHWPTKGWRTASPESQGMDSDSFSFAKKHLFEPLGISEVGWPSNPQGITLGYGQLFMRPHDMAKIGYLYLNNGLWDGKQIISSQKILSFQ